MDIYNIGASALTVYIPSGELRSKGLSAESLTADEATALLRDAVPEMEHYFSRFEVYSGDEAVLVFLFFSAIDPVFFCFNDIESVACAAKNCRGEPSVLYFLDEKYILAVYPWRGEEVPPALFEFGTMLNTRPEYEFCLREHGSVLIDSSAIDFLSQVFK